jgi:hypothetical protein
VPHRKRGREPHLRDSLRRGETCRLRPHQAKRFRVDQAPRKDLMPRFAKRTALRGAAQDHAELAASEHTLGLALELADPLA